MHCNSQACAHPTAAQFACCQCPKTGFDKTRTLWCGISFPAPHQAGFLSGMVSCATMTCPAHRTYPWHKTVQQLCKLSITWTMWQSRLELPPHKQPQNWASADASDQGSDFSGSILQRNADRWQGPCCLGGETDSRAGAASEEGRCLQPSLRNEPYSGDLRLSDLKHQG